MNVLQSRISFTLISLTLLLATVSSSPLLNKRGIITSIEPGNYYLHQAGLGVDWVKAESRDHLNVGLTNLAEVPMKIDLPFGSQLEHVQVIQDDGQSGAFGHQVYLLPGAEARFRTLREQPISVDVNPVGPDSRYVTPSHSEEEHYTFSQEPDEDSPYASAPKRSGRFFDVGPEIHDGHH